MIYRGIHPTVHAAQAKAAREKNRQRLERDASQPSQDEGGDGKLAAIKLPGNNGAVARADVVEAFTEA